MIYKKFIFLLLIILNNLFFYCLNKEQEQFHINDKRWRNYVKKGKFDYNDNLIKNEKPIEGQTVIHRRYEPCDDHMGTHVWYGNSPW